jgi:hypothetical protein
MRLSPSGRSDAHGASPRPDHRSSDASGPMRDQPPGSARTQVRHPFRQPDPGDQRTPTPPTGTPLATYAIVALQGRRVGRALTPPFRGGLHCGMVARTGIPAMREPDSAVSRRTPLQRLQVGFLTSRNASTELRRFAADSIAARVGRASPCRACWGACWSNSAVQRRTPLRPLSPLALRMNRARPLTPPFAADSIAAVTRPCLAAAIPTPDSAVLRRTPLRPDFLREQHHFSPT